MNTMQPATPLAQISFSMARSARDGEQIGGAVAPSMLPLEYALNAAQWGEHVSLLADGHGALYVRPIFLDANGIPTAQPGADITVTEYVAPASPTVAPLAASITYAYNGDNDSFDQLRVNNVNEAAANEKSGILNVAPPASAEASNAYASNAAAENVAATATVAATGAGTAFVVTQITAAIQGSLASANGLIVRLRSGAGGAILWQSYIGCPAGGCTVITANVSFAFIDTAAVIEFSAAGGVGTFQSVAISGYRHGVA